MHRTFVLTTKVTQTTKLRIAAEPYFTIEVRSHRTRLPSGILVSRLLPGVLGSVLCLLNNLDVIHGMFAAPPGYHPLLVQRSPDIAQYLTWLRGLENSWLLPNYHAPWTTPKGLVVPGLVPVSILEKSLSISPAVALQVFSLVGYVCTAYALAFAYRTFCRSRAQALWSFVIALACVPVASLPGLLRISGGHGLFSDSAGAVEFIYTSDGFLHGLGAWVFTTYGTCAQVLSVALLARYCNSHERRWLMWLAIACCISALVHPFEVFVTVTVASVVLLQQDESLIANLANLGKILLGGAIGLLPHIIGSLRVPWLHEVESANRHFVFVTPAQLLAWLGVPSILVVLLLLLGYPRRREPNVLILKTWFISTIVVFYLPGIPFAMHMLDGLFLAVGMLLAVQCEELFPRRFFSSKPALLLAMLVLAWMLYPHVAFRLRAWNDGNRPANDFPFSTAVGSDDEFAAVQWLRQHASPNDLVLATEDAAPWIATVPVHSFASHYVFSLQMERPRDAAVRRAFFDGELTSTQAHDFEDTFGFRFFVVPGGSRATSYLGRAIMRAHFSSISIYEIPEARMKPYGDAKIVQMGSL